MWRKKQVPPTPSPCIALITILYRRALIIIIISRHRRRLLHQQAPSAQYHSYARISASVLFLCISSSVSFIWMYTDEHSPCTARSIIPMHVYRHSRYSCACIYGIRPALQSSIIPVHVCIGIRPIIPMNVWKRGGRGASVQAGAGSKWKKGKKSIVWLQARRTPQHWRKKNVMTPAPFAFA